jgi:hypothetical protein
MSGVNYFFGLTTIISPYQRQLFFDTVLRHQECYPNE